MKTIIVLLFSTFFYLQLPAQCSYLAYEYFGAAPIAPLNASYSGQGWGAVILELRHPSTDIAARRAALLQRDGDVVDIDGVSPVAFQGLNPGNYYISVRHRNHLGVMSAGVYDVQP